MTHAVLRALHLWHRGVDVAVVLEEIQMPPRFLLKVMGRAFFAADRAGILGTAFGPHLQVLLMRLLVGIQSLIHQFPGSLYAEPKEQDLIAVHSGSSSLISRIQWHRLWGKFHTKRRRAKIKVRYSHAECRHKVNYIYEDCNRSTE